MPASARALVAAAVVCWRSIASSLARRRSALSAAALAASVSLISGQLMLLGAYPLNDPPKHMELFILKAEVIPVN